MNARQWAPSSFISESKTNIARRSVSAMAGCIAYLRMLADCSADRGVCLFRNFIVEEFFAVQGVRLPSHNSPTDRLPVHCNNRNLLPVFVPLNGYFIIFDCHAAGIG